MRPTALVLAAALAAAPAAAGEWALPAGDLFAAAAGFRGEACRAIGSRLGSVSIEDCSGSRLALSGGLSVEGEPILMAEFPPLAGRAPRGRVLLFGGIHGDELSSVSIVFKWMEILERYHSGLFHWRVVPALNPDGLLRARAQRVNARGVDLNRNFPSPRWDEESIDYWVRRTARNPRRYPGPRALSEPESRWLARQVASFRPDVIVAVHAPLQVLDFDGPPDPPQRLGPLWLSMLGTYPGSLGRWAGVHLGLPVVTIELPSAGILPGDAVRRRMWVDLVAWLETRLPPAETTRTSAR